MQNWKKFTAKKVTCNLGQDEGAKDLGLIGWDCRASMTITGVVKDAEGNVVAEKMTW